MVTVFSSCVRFLCRLCSLHFIVAKKRGRGSHQHTFCNHCFFPAESLKCNPVSTVKFILIPEDGVC